MQVMLGVRGLPKWKELGEALYIPNTKLGKIIVECNYDSWKCYRAVLSSWLEADPTPTWRRFIHALDVIGEQQTADSIRQYAEALTGIPNNDL